MNYGSYMSASGVLVNLHRMDVWANNLANVNTPGFKTDVVSMRLREAARADNPALAFTPSNEMLERLGAGVKLGPSRVDMSQGSIEVTNRELDLALRGVGFFTVSSSVDGTSKEVRLNRDGRLSLNARGELVMAASGLPTAYMCITSFSGGRLKPFFKRSFKTIGQQRLQHLVIDLRENGGGTVSNSVDLTQYLAAKPFKLGDSVVAISRKFRYGRYIHPAWPYWLVMNLAATKEKDGLIHFGHYEQHYFKPRKRFHFDGDVYLVQGGLTFSAASMMVATLKGQKNITVVGEETGGGYYGNSAMHIPTIRLPYSGLQVSLPMYRLVIDSSHPKGQGIVPDLEIKPSSGAIRKGIDPKIEDIRALIQRKSR